VLDIFKQQKSFLTRAKEKSSFRYVIDFDENGAFIEVCDKNNKPLSGVDYRVYNGLDREILQLLEEHRENDFFTISWGESESKMYLSKHPKLLELFHLSDNVYAQNEKIYFDDGIATVDLTIDENDKLYIAPFVEGESDFSFLTSSYVLVGNRVKQVRTVGESYTKLNSLHTVIDKEKLEEFLTIVFTHFENLSIHYNGYSVEEKEEKKRIKPAVIFEKVSADNELILRTSAMIGGLTPEFFNDFTVSKIVLIHEFDKSINVYECDYSDVFETYSAIYKQLSALKKTVKEAGFSEDEGLFVIDQALAGEFILHHLHTIIGTCEMYGSDKLKSYKYNASKPTLNVTFKNRVDLLGIDEVRVTIEEEEFNLFDMINLYKKHSYIPLSNGEKSIIDKSYMAKLERIFKKEGKNVKISFFDLPEIEELIAQKEQKVFHQSKAFYQGFESLKSSKTSLPKLNNATLRDYQKYGMQWLKYLYDNQFGGCLADDMGLGKTLQAIGLLSMIYPKAARASLIVMPKSLITNWQNELIKFNPNLSFYLYYGTTRDIAQFDNHHIILSTYAIVRNDIDQIKEYAFDTIILDESQNIKNIESQASKAMMLLNAKHKFALSGTPIENSLFELYSLFRFINNGMFSSINHFKNDFAAPIQGQEDEEIAQILKTKITPFILRRLKKDVLKELPAKQEQVIYVDMEDKHKAFYDQKRSYYKKVLEQQVASSGIENSKFAIFQAFNDLRQIASVPELKSDTPIPSSKIDSMFELLEDIVANRHKVLIFANYLGALDAIAAKADSMGYEYLTMTGSTKDRQALVDRFQNDKKISLFLMTLKVGGVGLNLTEADYVFIFDPWWNKAAENQAIDRAHRMGQKNTVFSYKMITKGTIEEKILELQGQKQDLSDRIISGDESGLKQITAQELEFLLG
jgi:superfamily II DNA or RNA helicase